MSNGRMVLKYDILLAFNQPIALFLLQFYYELADLSNRVLFWAEMFC